MAGVLEARGRVAAQPRRRLAPAAVDGARQLCAAVEPSELDEYMADEYRYRAEARARRERTGRAPGSNPRCGSCLLYQPFGTDACPHCGYSPTRGFVGK